MESKKKRVVCDCSTCCPGSTKRFDRVCLKKLQAKFGTGLKSSIRDFASEIKDSVEYFDRLVANTANSSTDRTWLAQKLQILKERVLVLQTLQQKCNLTEVIIGEYANVQREVDKLSQAAQLTRKMTI
jgi:hypothetical protein